MNPPLSGEIRAAKREGTKLQAATLSELCRVETIPREGPSGPSLGVVGEGSSPGRGFWSSPEPLRRRGGCMQRRPVSQLGKRAAQ